MATTDLTFLIKAKDEASGVFDTISKKTGALEGRFKKFNTAANIALGAIAVGVAKFASGSVGAYADAQESQAKLAAAFKQFPALSDTNQASLQKLNSALQDKTKFEDDAIASAQATLATMGLTGSQIKTLTPLMLDYAEKTGTNVGDAAVALGKSINGQTRALKTVGINYKSTGDQATDFQNISDALKTKVGGLAEEMGQTAAGKAEILHNKFGDLQESAGSKLLPILTNLTAAGIAVTGWMSRNQGVTIGLVGAVVALAVALKVAANWETILRIGTALSTGVKGAATAAQWLWNAATGAGSSTLATFIGVKALEAAAWVRATAAQVAAKTVMVAGAVATGVATAAQWALNVALTANPIGLIIAGIAALIAGLVLFFTKTKLGKELWAKFTLAMKVGWELIKGAFSAGWEAIKSFLGKAWDFIKKVWSFSPIGLIVTNWDKIMDFFKGVPGKIKSALANVGKVMFAPFKAAFNFIADGWNNSVGKLSFTVPDIPGVPGRGQTFAFPKLPHLATGGVVTSPTLALIGEGREPEAVIPLSKLNAMLNGETSRHRGNTYITVNEANDAHGTALAIARRMALAGA